MADPQLFFIEGHTARNLATEVMNLSLNRFRIVISRAREENSDHEGALLIDPFSVERTIHFVDRKAVNRQFLKNAVAAICQLRAQKVVEF
jgi:hypothetical protein